MWGTLSPVTVDKAAVHEWSMKVPSVSTMADIRSRVLQLPKVPERWAVGDAKRSRVRSVETCH